MISHWRVIVLFLQIASSTIALAPPYSGSTINLVPSSPQSNNSALSVITALDGALAVNASLLGTPYAAPNDATAEPQCFGDRYGYNISRTSCDDALSLIDVPAGNPVLVFGDRSQGLWDNRLPARWQSCK